MFKFKIEEGLNITLTLTGKLESKLGKEKFKTEVVSQVKEIVELLDRGKSLGLEFPISVEDFMLVFQIVTIGEEEMTIELAHVIGGGQVIDLC